MIPRAALQTRAREWGLTEEVVEKDYVLGWLLWGIGSNPKLRDRWIFKGGTCLKKCFVETYRFSEDLDFTVLDGGPLAPDDLLPVLAEMLDGVEQETGIEQIRFAGANHLLVDLRYQGSSRLIEPYALRRSKAGNLLVYAIKNATGEVRAYRVDRIEGVHITETAFTPPLCNRTGRPVAGQNRHTPGHLS